LAGGVEHRFLHPYLVHLKVRPPKLIQHGGQAFVWVLTGSADYLTRSADGRELIEVLNQGDSLFFDTSVPYDIRSRVDGRSAAADIVYVAWSPCRGEPPPWVPRNAEVDALSSADLSRRRVD
jgi:hypothetical protein